MAKNHLGIDTKKFDELAAEAVKIAAVSRPVPAAQETKIAMEFLHEKLVRLRAIRPDPVKWSVRNPDGTESTAGIAGLVAAVWVPSRGKPLSGSAIKAHTARIQAERAAAAASGSPTAKTPTKRKASQPKPAAKIDAMPEAEKPDVAAAETQLPEPTTKPVTEPIAVAAPPPEPEPPAISAKRPAAFGASPFRASAAGTVPALDENKVRQIRARLLDHISQKKPSGVATGKYLAGIPDLMRIVLAVFPDDDDAMRAAELAILTEIKRLNTTA